MKRLLIAAAIVLCASQARAALPFVENDYAKASAQAAKLNVPLFVEAWAPW